MRGRRGAWSPSIDVGGSLATSEALGRRFVLWGKHSVWSISGSFYVAGAALGVPQVRFAWQTQHPQYLRFILCGRATTWSISGSFYVAGAALGAPS